MQRLQSEGLLAITGGGARPRVAVAALDADEAVECYRLVAQLEGGLARAITQWPTGSRRALADELQQLDEEFVRASKAVRPNLDRLHERHAAFHDRLRAAAAGPVTRELLAVLAPRLERYQWFHGPVLLQAGIGFDETYAEHAAIIEGVRSGNADNLQAAIRANWEGAAARFRAAMP
jgi:DNA-binding GntR family transcriptional regulator